MSLPDFVIPTTFQVTNPGQAPIIIDAEKWTLKRYQDITTNARTLNITTKPDVPIQQFAEILAYDGSEVAFRGYAETYKNSRKENVWNCRGVENLLWHRYCHKFNYSMVSDSDGGGTWFTLANAIKDHYSSGRPITRTTTDACPGILHVANSLMPWGMPFTVYDGAKAIIKYSGWGTASRLGATPVLFYIDDNGVYELIQRAALADLQTYDTSFYISSTDLYIRNTTNLGATNAGWPDYWYYNGRIMANNCFDTKIRLGTIDNDTDALIGFLKTGFKDTVASVLFSALQSFGLYPYLYDDMDYTYIYAWSTSEGMIGPADPLYTIDESEQEIITWEKSIPAKPHVHSLRGYGVAEQVYSFAYPPNYQGYWYEDLWQVNDGFRDANGILTNDTNAEFNNRYADYQYLIKTGRKILARPGDYIQVIPKYAGSEILPVNVITHDSDGTCQLEINNKTPLLTNAWMRAGVLPGLYSNYVVHDIHDSVSGSVNFNFRSANFPACAIGTISLVVPDISTDYQSRVTIDLSLTCGPLQVPKTWEPLRFMVFVSVNYNANENCIIYNYAWGDPITDIDVTSLITKNATNIVGVQVYFMGNNVPNSPNDCTHTQSQITASATMHFKTRKDLSIP